MWPCLFLHSLRGYTSMCYVKGWRWLLIGGRHAFSQEATFEEGQAEAHDGAQAAHQGGEPAGVAAAEVVVMPELQGGGRG